MKCTASCWQSKVIWLQLLISTAAAVSRSGGQDMLNMSVKTELTDLTQVMEKLRSRPL